MIERRIKELSIALEALSRINHYNALRLFDDVTEQLRALVDQNKSKPKPVDMGDKVEVDAGWKPPNPDDEIPF